MRPTLRSPVTAAQPDPREPDFSRPAPIPGAVRALKRALDLVSSSMGLLVISPLMGGIALAIRLESPGPIFYRQPRMRPGPDGRPVPFDMLKFRSMCDHAEDRSGPVWATEEGADQRITHVGHLLRKHHLDELPQLINVLRGEMSLIGPRPERPHFTTRLARTIPGYDDRLMVIKPGITGWAQVQCGYDTDLESVHEKMLHDLAYLAHLYQLDTYLRMEARVIWRTFGAILSGRGAA